MPLVAVPIGLAADGSIDHAACARAAEQSESPTVAALGRVVVCSRRCGLLASLRWLRFSRRYRSRRLGRASLRCPLPATRAPDCADCTDTCCAAPNLVSLRLVDVARLHDVGLGWAIVAPRPSRRLSIYATHPELEAIEARDSFRRFPVLRQRETGRCVFLDDAGRCAIYPRRPLACRRFPYLLTDDLRSVRWASNCVLHRKEAGVQERLLAAVRDNHDRKLDDLWLLYVARESLAPLGILHYLPGQGRRGGRRFAAVMLGKGEGIG